ncbi:MAG TPA: DUF3562 domain-containing protein [Burkholderiales bacterium]|nr:DUF3562 domain-containing protein [Burkholderiales bacterium]
MSSDPAPSDSTVTSDARPEHQDEATPHVYAIQALAKESNWPVPVVADMYLDQLSRLQRDATIQTYLTVLTTRKVRDALRRLPARPAAASRTPA